MEKLVHCSLLSVHILKSLVKSIYNKSMHSSKKRSWINSFELVSDMTYVLELGFNWYGMMHLNFKRSDILLWSMRIPSDHPQGKAPFPRNQTNHFSYKYKIKKLYAKIWNQVKMLSRFISLKLKCIYIFGLNHLKNL